MYVYRWENKRGQGPYNSYRVDRTDWTDRSHNGRKHPEPKEENLPWKPGLICGFIDFKQARQWFNVYERAALAELGFEFKVFRIAKKHVWVSKKQCTFVRKHATRVNLL